MSPRKTRRVNPRSASSAAARPKVAPAATAAAPTPTSTATAVATTPDRDALIAQLEGLRQSRVICYATGDRKNQETQIGADALPVIYKHLTTIGRVPRLDLLIYSRGGDTQTGFALANALREFADHVAVLVPFRSHSCATLIALGADEIVMGPLGQLSPIDPSITTPHGPYVEEGGKRSYIPVSVEDAANYFELARKEAKLEREESMAQVLGHLAERVSPLALGAVYRAREQIGMLADKLLALHMSDKSRREKIMKILTRELLSHDYIIARREAQEIGLQVVVPPDDHADLMWAIYQSIADELKLGEFFDLDPAHSPVRSIRCVLQSRSLKHIFASDYRVTRSGTDIKADTIREGWAPA